MRRSRKGRRAPVYAIPSFLPSAGGHHIEEWRRSVRLRVTASMRSHGHAGTMKPQGPRPRVAGWLPGTDGRTGALGKVRYRGLLTRPRTTVVSWHLPRFGPTP